MPYFGRRLLFLFAVFSLLGVHTAFAEPLVRVLVSENQKLVRLTVKGEYEMRLLPSLEAVKPAPRLSQIAVTPTPTGIKIGDKVFSARGLRIRPKTDRDLYLDGTRFRGSIDILKNPAHSLNSVNSLEVEKYLYGVLHHEVAPWWPMEALKAQAVAARTYALYQAQVSKAQAYDLKSSTSSQVYGGSTTERTRSKRAVEQTRGVVLKFDSKLFPAYFHATCGGRTAAARELWNIDLTPLKGGVECTYCRISPHFEWESKVSLVFLEEKMKKNGRPVGQVLKLEPLSQTPSGRVGRLRISGNTGECELAAKDFRVWLGGDKIRSTHFTVSIVEDQAVFKGKGWGHGVGLCQWGALGQSLLGHSYEKILGFYYPGAALSSYEPR